MNYIDTHCHLFAPPLSTSPASVLARAATAGVTTVIVPAFDHASWPQVIALATAAPATVLPALGLHPWAATEPFDTADLACRLRACNAVAIGEIGLDTTTNHATFPRQLEILRLQLNLAVDLDLPVILHCRGAFHELRDLIIDINTTRGTRLRGVLHAWSRGPELAREFLDLGLYLGLGGAVTRTRAKRLRRALPHIPLERILLETDAPSIGLEGVRPEHTEPRHVADIALTLARLRGENLETIAEETSDNARRLFRLQTGTLHPDD